MKLTRERSKIGISVRYLRKAAMTEKPTTRAIVWGKTNEVILRLWMKLASFLFIFITTPLTRDRMDMISPPSWRLAAVGSGLMPRTTTM